MAEIKDLLDRTWKEHLECSVCRDTFKKTSLTPCMHRFCMECITGCLDLYNECPLCKRNISKNDLLFDLDFDKLIEFLSKERTKVEQSVLQNVLQQDAIDEHDFASPVIAVLKEHLKQSVDAQDYFFSDLKADHKVKEDDLRKNFNSRLNRDQQETEKHALDLKKLHEKFMRCGELMAVQYNEFLNANLPKFDVLPVIIYVEIPTLNSELEFQLKMQDSLDDLRSMVMQSMQQKQMEIAKWDEEARYFLCSPLTEVLSLEQLTSNELTTNEVTELSDTSIPVMQYSMKSGSKLLIAGNFVLEKDTPKPCFRQKQVATPTTMNYYSCKECDKNFICEPCRKACHEGHTTSSHLEDYKPSWRCCYCSSQKRKGVKCQLYISTSNTSLTSDLDTAPLST